MQEDENDPLLDDEQGQYGGIEGGDVLQPDEEELRREREELEQITMEATEYDLKNKAKQVIPSD